MHKRKKVKHSDIMTIKRDKFQNIIRILELDIFNDCHLSWAMRCEQAVSLYLYLSSGYMYFGEIGLCGVRRTKRRITKHRSQWLRLIWQLISVVAVHATCQAKQITF